MNLDNITKSSKLVVCVLLSVREDMCGIQKKISKRKTIIVYNPLQKLV